MGSSKRKSRSASKRLHPHYSKMITTALNDMKHPRGSKFGSIMKSIQGEWGHVLPADSRKHLGRALRRLMRAGKLDKDVTNRYMLTATRLGRRRRSVRSHGGRRRHRRRSHRRKRRRQTRRPRHRRRRVRRRRHHRRRRRHTRRRR